MTSSSFPPVPACVHTKTHKDEKRPDARYTSTTKRNKQIYVRTDDVYIKLSRKQRRSTSSIVPQDQWPLRMCSISRDEREATISPLVVDILPCCWPGLVNVLEESYGHLAVSAAGRKGKKKKACWARNWRHFHKQCFAIAAGK
jgi:hypothetical protein